MPRVDIVRESVVERTPRVQQVEGMFEMPPTTRSGERWSFDVPIEDREWLVGLIVGPSGSGKSTVAGELFGSDLIRGYEWPDEAAVADAIAPERAIKEVVAALSAVGFSSPPAWLRPFGALSTGEQFRANLARALLDGREVVAVDEFTSVVDRRVAKIASAALSKAVRRTKRRFVAVSCHHDVEEWLQPDWLLEMPTGSFTWRDLRRRPPVSIEVQRAERDEWRRFRRHHYLDHDLHRGAACFVGYVEGAPAVFVSVLFFPHPKRPGWREHRTVCLPDFQGVGIGNAASDLVARAYRATGKPYRSTTGNPAMIYARARSPRWKMTRRPSRSAAQGRTGSTGHGPTVAFGRFTASFEYVGGADRGAAERLGIIR